MKGGKGGELGERFVADGKDSPLRGGTQARIELHVDDQDAKKEA